MIFLKCWLLLIIGKKEVFINKCNIFFKFYDLLIIGILIFIILVIVNLFNFLKFIEVKLNILFIMFVKLIKLIKWFFLFNIGILE